jgi:ubiquinone/menaquinone biosynthesis C-methylase UbiE
MVVSDIEHVKRIGFKSIDFVDSVFNVPMEHAVACCEAIAEADLKLPLQTVGFNPAQCSPELVEAMNRAGFTAVGCTAESASDRMLASLNKGFGSEKLRETAHALRKLNAVRLWLFMLGGPGETEQTVKETADFMRDSLSTKDLVYVGCGIRILPGAELHSTAVEEQIIREGDDLIEPQFNFFASSYARKSNVNNIRVRLPEVKHHKCSREQPEITAADADTGPQDGHYSSILAVRTFVEQASQSSSVCSKWLLEMLLTRHRKEIEELLDRPENTLREVERSLSDLEWTNRWFRGRNALFSHLLSLLEQAGSFLDVACGSGDMVRALSDRCKSMRISPLIVGADINPTVLTVARKRSASYSDIDFIEADALALPFADRSFDVVFSSTFLHQLNPDKAVTALKEASRVAGKHLIISDLVRHDLALVGVWLIGWFLFERISRYDGVTSVKRAYTHREMLELADKAELFGSRVYNHPFFRMALVYDKSDR